MCTKNIQKPSQGYGKFNNSKWLKILGFTTLLEGGMRGDLIETFKILKKVRTYLREHIFTISKWAKTLMAHPIKLTDFFRE